MALGVFIRTHRLDAENIYNELIDGKLTLRYVRSNL
jgi:hypothetical protein